MLHESCRVGEAKKFLSTTTWNVVLFTLQTPSVFDTNAICISNHTTTPCPEVCATYQKILECQKTFMFHFLKILNPMGNWRSVNLSFLIVQAKPMVTNTVFNVIQLDILTSITLLLTIIMLQAADAPWLKITLTLISKRLCTVYRRLVLSFSSYTRNQTWLWSCLLQKNRWTYSIPTYKEGKKLHTAGHKFYSAMALGMKATNYIACVGRYQSETTAILPENKHLVAWHIQKQNFAGWPSNNWIHLNIFWTYLSKCLQWL